jgi:hypothetical protein
MTLALLFAACLQDAEPRAALVELQKSYAALTSFSATIVHHDDSGLFPGDYTQELKWRKGGRFELVVTKPSGYTASLGAPGSSAPNYFADGKSVVSIHSGGKRSSDSLEVRENMAPGWEVSGGPVMGWLQSTPLSKLVMNPPKDIRIEYEFAKTASWQGEKVKEILMRWTAGPQTVPISFYLSRDGKSLVGYAFSREGRTGWCHYKSQKMNPPLPESLGTAPK